MALSLLFLSFILPFVFGTPPIWPTSAILSCPCTFSIARPLNATAPSNILFIRLSDWQALPRSSSYSSIAAIAHISHPLSIHRATSHPTHLRLQPITVREHGQFAAVVSQGVHVEPFRLLNVKRVNGTCPVIIQEHPPSQPPTTLPPTTPPSTNQSTPVSSRIVGGHLAAKALGPYLVFLITGQTGCTGTLIGSRWILTAAHCGTNSSTIVYFGENAHNLFSEAYGVQKVYNHIQYAKGYPFEQWDIAVLKLAQPAPSAARFLKVNINPTIPIPGSAVRAIGFGFTMSYNQSLPPDGGEDGKLRQVDLPVVTHSDCERLYRVSLVEKIQVCAGYRNGGCDSCQGDSGGPIIQYDEDGEPVLVGVISRGMDCAKPLSPGIYTRTGGFQEWLDMLHIKYTKRNHTRAVRVIGSPLLEDGTGIDGPNDTTIGSVDEDSPIYENGSDTIKIVGAIVAVVLVLVVVLILSIIYMKQRRTREATG